MPALLYAGVVSYFVWGSADVRHDLRQALVLAPSDLMQRPGSRHYRYMRTALYVSGATKKVATLREGCFDVTKLVTVVQAVYIVIIDAILQFHEGTKVSLGVSTTLMVTGADATEGTASARTIGQAAINIVG